VKPAIGVSQHFARRVNVAGSSALFQTCTTAKYRMPIWVSGRFGDSGPNCKGAAKRKNRLLLAPIVADAIKEPFVNFAPH